jgi:hypothetical protein
MMDFRTERGRRKTSAKPMDSMTKFFREAMKDENLIFSAHARNDPGLNDTRGILVDPPAVTYSRL